MKQIQFILTVYGDTPNLKPKDYLHIRKEGVRTYEGHVYDLLLAWNYDKRTGTNYLGYFNDGVK